MKITAKIIIVSDKKYNGEEEDASGPAISEMLRAEGIELVSTILLPAEEDRIVSELIRQTEEKKPSLVLTLGATGFSARDIVPEATMRVVERMVPGLPEAMRAESMRITPRGCLSRETAGIRGNTLIVNLPGSPKAATENLRAVLPGIRHGAEMLAMQKDAADHGILSQKKMSAPSLDLWLKEAKRDPDASKVGMYLAHNGVVRKTARAAVRQGESEAKPVSGMEFSHDRQKVEAAIAEARRLPGIFYVRVWLNEGHLDVGDDLMLVLIGGDIRPHVVAALENLVGRLKSECVNEREIPASSEQSE